MKFIRYMLPFIILAFLSCILAAGQLLSYPTQGERIASRALEYLDVPYVLSRKDPKAFDCSGFLVYLFEEEGIELPHSAELIGTDKTYAFIENIRDLRVGDIVCFDTIEDNDPCDHVGVYLGKKSFVHASSTYGKVVVSRISDIYLETFTGARRIADVSLNLRERLDLFKASVRTRINNQEDIA